MLDADITGPSIPRLLGVDKQRARASEEFIYPAVTADGIKVMSLNLLIEKKMSLLFGEEQWSLML